MFTPNSIWKINLWIEWMCWCLSLKLLFTEGMKHQQQHCIIIISIEDSFKVKGARRSWCSKFVAESNVNFTVKHEKVLVRWRWWWSLLWWLSRACDHHHYYYHDLEESWIWKFCCIQRKMSWLKHYLKCSCNEDMLWQLSWVDWRFGLR